MMNIKIKLSEETRVLSPQNEVFEVARRIEKETVTDPKYLFTLQYEASQKDLFLSILHTIGAGVVAENERNYTIDIRMNMAQLKLMKDLNCVEYVNPEGRINTSTVYRVEAYESAEESEEVLVARVGEALREEYGVTYSCMV